jgi:hypothetical protein
MPAYAQPPAIHQPAPQLASHNGSLMQVESRGNGEIVIRYVDPKPELRAIGVGPGTVLLHGTWGEQGLRATAVVFTFTCGPVPYAVDGSVSRDGILTVIGAAPVIDPWHCVTVGYTWTSPNASLVFIPWQQRR